MREFPGINSASLPDAKADDFAPRLRNMLSTLEVWARDASFGFGRINQGQVPSGTGQTIVEQTVDLSQYFLLPGRSGGQTAYGGTAPFESLTLYGSSGNEQFGYTLPYLRITQNLPFGVCEINDPTVYSSGGHQLLNLIYNNSGASGGARLFSIANANGAGDVVLSFTADISSNAILRIGSGIPSSFVTYDHVETYGLWLNRSGGGGRLTVNPSSTTSSHTLILPPAQAAGALVNDGSGTLSWGGFVKSNLTGQTGSIAAQTLLTGTATTAGMYRVSAYLKTTTAQAASSVLMTLAWNDGTAQTLVMPLESATAIFNAHDLTTNNAHSQGSVVVNAAASQNISYTTTITGGGTAAYEIHVRTEALG